QPRRLPWNFKPPAKSLRILGELLVANEVINGCNSIQGVNKSIVRKTFELGPLREGLPHRAEISTPVNLASRGVQIVPEIGNYFVVGIPDNAEFEIRSPDFRSKQVANRGGVHVVVERRGGGELAAAAHDSPIRDHGFARVLFPSVGARVHAVWLEIDFD